MPISSLLTVRRPSPGGVSGEHRCVHVAHRAAAVPAARRALVAELRQDPVATTVADDVAVVASELLGNAVRHAVPVSGGGVLLCWAVQDGAVEVQVVDGGRRDPARRGAGSVDPRAQAPMATGGRGLSIVDHLAQAWGSRTDDGGQHTVWASVSPASAARDLAAAG